MNKKIALISILILLVLAASTTAAQETCNPKGDTDFCIKSVETPTDEIVEGSTYVIEATVVNTGNESGDVNVIYGGRLPSGQVYGSIGVAEGVEPGEDVVIRQEAQVLNPGYRTINIMAMDVRETHLYDSTGYEMSFTASEDTTNWYSIFSRVNVILGIVASVLTISGYLFFRR